MITRVNRIALSVIDIDRRRQDSGWRVFSACLVSLLCLASLPSPAHADANLTHNVGNVEMHVSDWGAFVKFDDLYVYPNFGYLGRYYIHPFSNSGVWAGNSAGWVASAIDGFEGDFYYGEWQPTTPSGHVEYIPDHPNASQCIHAQYAPDRYNDFPFNITVDQYTYAWDSAAYPDDADYILMKLVLTNLDSFGLEDFYLAVQTDWDMDIMEETDDLVDWDAERYASIAYDSDGTDTMYVALTLMDGKLASHNIVDWDRWEYLDSDRADLMSNGEMDDLDTISSAPGNYLNIVSTGPYNVPAGGTVSVIYAFAIGEGLDELQDNLDAARKRIMIPGKLTAEPGEAIMRLAWAESISSDVAGYRVYRSNTSGSSYSEIAQVSAENTAYNDTQVQMGIMYYYVVTAIGLDGRESQYSNEVYAVPGVSPKSPQNLTVDGDTAFHASTEIILHWEPSENDNIIGYKIFRSSTGSGPWTAIAEVDGNAQSFIDRNVYDGDTYYYTIAAVNTYNWTSEYSNVISVTIDLPGPLDPAVNLEAVTVAPNPCGLLSAGKLRFIHLPATAKIHIYTSSGSLVKTLYHTDESGEEEWDLRNEQGAVLASGIYVYYIESYKAEETGKLTTSGKFALIK